MQQFHRFIFLIFLIFVQISMVTPNSLINCWTNSICPGHAAPEINVYSLSLPLSVNAFVIGAGSKYSALHSLTTGAHAMYIQYIYIHPIKQILVYLDKQWFFYHLIFWLQPIRGHHDKFEQSLSSFSRIPEPFQSLFYRLINIQELDHLFIDNVVWCDMVLFIWSYFCCSETNVSHTGNI